LEEEVEPDREGEGVREREGRGEDVTPGDSVPVAAGVREVVARALAVEEGVARGVGEARALPVGLRETVVEAEREGEAVGVRVEEGEREAVVVPVGVFDTLELAEGDWERLCWLGVTEREVEPEALEEAEGVGVGEPVRLPPSAPPLETLTVLLALGLREAAGLAVSLTDGAPLPLTRVLGVGVSLTRWLPLDSGEGLCVVEGSGERVVEGEGVRVRVEVKELEVVEEPPPG
jgi:hypothetical protein